MIKITLLSTIALPELFSVYSIMTTVTECQILSQLEKHEYFVYEGLFRNEIKGLDIAGLFKFYRRSCTAIFQQVGNPSDSLRGQVILSGANKDFNRIRKKLLSVCFVNKKFSLSPTTVLTALSGCIAQSAHCDYDWKNENSKNCVIVLVSIQVYKIL